MNYAKRLQLRRYAKHLPTSVNICNPVSHNFCLWTQCEAFCKPFLGSDRGTRRYVRPHFVFSVDRQHEVLEEERCQVVPSRQAPFLYTAPACCLAVASVTERMLPPFHHSRLESPG